MKKDWKTTTLGISGLLYLLVGIILSALKVVSITDFASSLALVAVFLTSILGFFAGDSKPKTNE